MSRPVGSQNLRRPYAEAREFVHTLNLSNSTAWWTWSKSGQRPADIPGNPHTYRQEFTDWYDWLGTTRPVNQRRVRSKKYRAEPEQKRAQRLAERAALVKKSKSEPSEKKSRAEKIIEPADVQYQLAKYYKQQAAAKRAEKDGEPSVLAPGGTRETDAPLEPVKPTDAPRPTYAERRRAEQKCKVKPVWTVCREGHASLRADRFRSAVDATSAAMEYSSAKGYEVFIGECERCSTALGRTVWHVYRDPQNKSAPCRRSMRENN
jgi:hypothetical protein